jgi:hypothetical protein
VATAVGARGFLLGIEALGRVPVAGFRFKFLLVTVGFGAVLVTYFGIREFEPARMPK